MADPAAFRSDRLPTEHYDARFSDANMEYWVPLLVHAGEITSDTRVLELSRRRVGRRALAVAGGARPLPLLEH